MTLQISGQSRLEDASASQKNIERVNEKINFITQFASKPYFNKLLKKLAGQNIVNALIICDYIIAEQTEINIKQSTKEGKIKILTWLSNFHAGKSFKEMTRDSCYHAMANDMSARPHEILSVRISHIKFNVTEDGIQYASAKIINA